MMFGKKTIIGAGTLLLLGTVAFSRIGPSAEANAGPEHPTSAAERSELVLRAEAAGIIEPIRVVEVKSKASGEVLELYVETGDAVPRGAPLAQIDPRDVQSALEQAQADLEVAEVQAQTTEAHRQRTEELRRASVVTQQEYENAIQSAANARASLVRAQTNLQLARERRGDVSIAAPIAGTIIERTVEVGQIIASATSNVSGGTTLLKMADLSEMQVRALVDETDIGAVQPGNQVQVTVEAYPERAFRGEVLKIEPQAVVDQNVTMFPVIVRLENREGLLRPGMNAGISIEIARRTEVVTIANEAVVATQDADAVARGLGASGRGSAVTTPGGLQGRAAVAFVRTPSGIEMRPIVLGISDWDRSEVLYGLAEGDEVVLATVARMEAQQQQRMPRGPFGGRGN